MTEDDLDEKYFEMFGKLRNSDDWGLCYSGSLPTNANVQGLSKYSQTNILS